MRILGIETSCDESAVAVLDIAGPAAKPRVKVLANVVASQVKLHAKFGGVVPNLAKREHQRNLVPVLLMALKEAGLLDKAKMKKQKVKMQGKNQNILSPIRSMLSAILEREPDLFARMVSKITALPVPKIDAIAVTVGPGLAPALWVGVNFARALSCLWEKPLIAVNHLEGHIVTNLLPQNDQNDENDKAARRLHRVPLKTGRSVGFIDLIKVRFPALCLIVSGNHTELVLMRRHGDYRVLGETRDDAAGEAFDKVARMLEFGFPGGPIISRLAGTGDSKAFNCPRPMMNSIKFDFSFSGLKTSVLYTLRDLKQISGQTKRDIAASFEQAVVDVLVAKTV
ncbi:MAG: tRNA (adenosine(37)-N6)-threonylcarbamoyltransferase complex transferase subunit TsaD, partial [bacterium]|nr:tRNA (adenosine(37)-N6)-threonylcarbamoyltransferase complex transferase subunit TsaD [bacterium]